MFAWAFALFMLSDWGSIDADELREVSEFWTVESASSTPQFNDKENDSVETDEFVEVSPEWGISILDRQNPTIAIDKTRESEAISVAPIAGQIAPADKEFKTALPFSFDPIGSGSGEVIATPEADSFVLDDSVPEGFEALAGPQTHFVDIYFNERKVGSTTITGTDETFVFDTPEAVFSMLDGIKKPDELALLLAMSFDSNAHLICYRVNDPIGCGQVEADPVAALYNSSELKVELFLSQDFQAVMSTDQVLYLPTAERRNSAIASFNGVATDLYGQGSSVDVSSRALVGYGNGHLAAQFDYNTRSNRKRLREVKLSHFFKKHELEIGSYTYHSGGALSDFGLFGASFSSTLSTRVDLEHAFSSELVVYLTRRSVVQLLVNDQIYSGNSYTAGNQVLDTRALPEGTYEVEIRILDPVAGERSELRIFTKSTQIPPRGEWVYNATVGIPIVFDDKDAYPELTSTAVIGASIAQRLSDSSAAKVGGLQLGKRSFLQTEYLYLGREFSFQAAATMGEDQTLATSFLGNYTKNRFSAGLSLDSFRTNVKERNTGQFADVYQDDYKQFGMSLGKSFKKYHLGLRSSHREQTVNGADSSSNQYALTYRRSLFNSKSVRGFFDATLQKDESERQFLLKLKVFFKRDQWLHALSGELNNGEFGGNTQRTVAETHWQSTDLIDYQIGLGAYASRAHDGKSMGLDLDVQHALFSAGLSSDWNQRTNGDYQQNKIASVSAHLGLDGRGFAIGGTDFAQAGVIIAVKGEPKGERFDIVVNGAKTSTGQIGKNQFIGLQPFETYRIKLVPKTLLSNGIGGDVYEFTLYPGNVQRIDVTTERKVLLIATLVDDAGQLLDEGVVELTPNPQLLSIGGFLQAEVSPGKVLQVRSVDGSVCEFVVPDGDNDDVLVLDEPLHCRSVKVPKYGRSLTSEND